MDVGLCDSRDLEPPRVLDQWLEAGVRLIQLRAKDLTFGPFLQLAEHVAVACGHAGAIFIVNDRLDVAQLAGAAGVHLGQEDLSPEDARSAWPGARWIGRSTHNDEQVAAALRSAATYLAIGPVFETRTKAKPDPVIGLEGVRAAAAAVRPTNRPLVAIGGITLDTIPSVLAAGADAVAIVSGLLEGSDVGAQARAYVRTVESSGLNG